MCGIFETFSQRTSPDSFFKIAGKRVYAPGGNGSAAAHLPPLGIGKNAADSRGSSLESNAGLAAADMLSSLSHDSFCHEPEGYAAVPLVATSAPELRVEALLPPNSGGALHAVYGQQRAGSPAVPGLTLTTPPGDVRPLLEPRRVQHGEWMAVCKNHLFVSVRRQFFKEFNQFFASPYGARCLDSVYLHGPQRNREQGGPAARLAGLFRGLAQLPVEEIGLVQKQAAQALLELLELMTHTTSMDHEGAYQQMVESFRDAYQKVQATLAPGRMQYRSLAKLQRAMLKLVARAIFLGVEGVPLYRDTAQSVIGCMASDSEPLADPEALKYEPPLDRTVRYIEETLHFLREARRHIVSMEQDPVLERHQVSKLGRFAHGYLGIGLDPILRNANAPALLPPVASHWDPLRPFVTAIRMGAPTRGDVTSSQVTEEFLCFLEPTGDEELDKALGGSTHHVYFVRQQRENTLAESRSSRALNALNDVPKLRGAVTVITLPTDGDLYQVQGPFSKKNCPVLVAQNDTDTGEDSFCYKVAEAMIRGEFGCFLPESITGSSAKEKSNFHMVLYSQLSALATQMCLHKEAPDGLGDCDAHRRALLFHYFNQQFPQAIFIKTHATSFNITCKDGIDRAGMANAYLHFDNIFPLLGNSVANEWSWPNEKIEFKKYLDELIGIAFGPALLSHSRAVLKPRFSDLENALEFRVKLLTSPAWRRNLSRRRSSEKTARSSSVMGRDSSRSNHRTPERNNPSTPLLRTGAGLMP